MKSGDTQTYTNEEIQDNIKILTDHKHLLHLKRSELTHDINSLKQQIEYWLKLDQSQKKLF